MKLRINKKLAEHINELCLNEENSDVHFVLPFTMKHPKATKVSFIYLLTVIAKCQLSVHSSFASLFVII
jgi:hypothetical protein